MEEDDQLEDDILRLKRAIDIDDGAKPGPSNISRIGDDNRSTNSTTQDLADDSSGLPEIESSLESCLVLNRMYQDLIQDAIKEFEGMLATNKELQRKLREKTVESSQPKKLQSLQETFNIPYFKDANGHVPPYNDDTLIKKANKELDAHVRTPRPWSLQEKQILQSAVKCSRLEVAMRPIMSRKEDLCMELERSDLTDEQRVAKENEIEEKDKQMSDLTTSSDVLPAWAGNVKCDWLKISSQDFDGKRDALECELYWNNYLCPEVNKGKWNSKEIQSLRALVEELGRNNWEKVAATLGTGRTALQCLEKYQVKYANDMYAGRKWTPEEDAKCLEIIEKYRVGDYIPWHQVVYHFEGRTNTQIWSRWKKIDPLVQRGRFSAQEDLMLLASTYLLGAQHWFKIKEFLPGRNSTQCYDRWNFSLNPALNHKPFSKEEDETILRMADEVSSSGKWKIISKELKNRHSTMVYNRYLSLKGRKSKSGYVSNKRTRSVGSKSIPKYVALLNCQLGQYVRYLNKTDKKLSWCVSPISLLRHLQSVSKSIAKMPGIRTLKPSRDPVSNNKYLNDLMTKLKSYGCKTLMRYGTKNCSDHPIDGELDNYFTSVCVKKRKGRPITRAVLNPGDEGYCSVVSGFQKVLRMHVPDIEHQQPELDHELAGTSQQTSETDHQQPESVRHQPNVGEKQFRCSERIPFLPPSWFTMDAFRKLLRMTPNLSGRMGVKQCLREVHKFSPFETKTPADHNLDDSNSSESEKPNDAAAYPLLFQRFTSIFFWPAVLSAHSPKTTAVLETNFPKRVASKREKWLAPKRPHWRKRAMRKQKATQMNEASTSKGTSSQVACTIATPDANGTDEDPTGTKKRRGRPRGPTQKKTLPVVPRRSARSAKLETD